MKVLLDTNVILDILFRREQWLVAAGQTWQAHVEERIQAYVSASTVTDIFYITRRKTNLDVAREAVTKVLQTLEIAPVDRTILAHANQLPGRDFEDNVQIACAAKASLDAIVTRNTEDFKLASVPVLTPGELLQRIDETDE